MPGLNSNGNFLATHRIWQSARALSLTKSSKPSGPPFSLFYNYYNINFFICQKEKKEEDFF